MTKERIIQAVSKNKNLVKILATLSVVSALGVMAIDTEKFVQVGEKGKAPIFVTRDTSMEDFKAYIEMMNYEIQQNGGSVELTNIDKKDKRAILLKLNEKFAKREPKEFKGETERKKYELAREVLMKKSENVKIEVLENLFKGI